MSTGNWQLRSKTSQADWKLARWQLLQAKRINYLGIMPGEQAWWMQYIIPCHDCMSALGNKEQPVPWDTLTVIFALSEGCFCKTRKMKRVSLFSLKLYVWMAVVYQPLLSCNYIADKHPYLFYLFHNCSVNWLFYWVCVINHAMTQISTKLLCSFPPFSLAPKTL